MNVSFLCSECNGWTRTGHVGASTWPCSVCQAVVTAAAPSDSKELTICRVCGNPQLYVKKAFPHGLGIAILVIAFAGFITASALYWIMTSWIILLGSALIDVILYFMMGNATVCYRCGAEYYGFPSNPEHGPFDLAIGERYRQERLRKSELRNTQSETNPNA